MFYEEIFTTIYNVVGILETSESSKSKYEMKQIAQSSPVPTNTAIIRSCDTACNRFGRLNVPIAHVFKSR
ncbi:unnamed protein product [Litomosoides sigmodontis]|uniref:Uncharacterized protein n=1 Tax=Litomosoides sigmodontis TaxID=42156 RepID=A0A3P6UTQ7_LITSI|nr:unnamed protein product [Litomosoides sigmodontis]